MISHYNVIANVLQWRCHNEPHRQQLGPNYTEVALGLLPQSHIYSLVVNCCAGMYLGDQLIVLQKFKLDSYLSAISRFRIETLVVVPPIIVTMTANKTVCDHYNLSSVRRIICGAAPLGEETTITFSRQYPEWIITQAYGKHQSPSLDQKEMGRLMRSLPYRPY